MTDYDPPQPPPRPPAPPPWPPPPAAGHDSAEPGYAYTYGQQPHGGYQYMQAPMNETKAILALVLSIVAFVACPVVPAIAALVLANMAMRDIRESNGRLTGEGLANAARIVAWIHLGLVGAGVLLVAFLIALGAASSP